MNTRINVNYPKPVMTKQINFKAKGAAKYAKPAIERLVDNGINNGRINPYATLGSFLTMIAGTIAIRTYNRSNKKLFGASYVSPYKFKDVHSYQDLLKNLQQNPNISILYDNDEEVGANISTIYNTWANSTDCAWYKENGQLKYERLADGTIHGWYKNGQLEYEKLSNGTYRFWYENGQLGSEELPNGTARVWYENGQMKHESLANGIITRDWRENGSKICEELPFGIRRWYHDKGQKI